MNPLKEIVLRGNDPTGHGHYGANRGKRKHFGVDLLAEHGTEVLAPFSGFITKHGYVYKNNTEIRLIEITGDVYRTYLMYGTLSAGIEVGDRVFTGDVIGTVQNIAGHHGGKMKNHLHYQLWKHGLLTDPEPLIIPFNSENLES